MGLKSLALMRAQAALIQVSVAKGLGNPALMILPREMQDALAALGLLLPDVVAWIEELNERESRK
jgi:hypothetical protein